MAKKRKSYFHFKFKLFWAAIFRVDAFLLYVIYTIATSVRALWVFLCHDIRFLRHYTSNPSNVHSLATNSDIWLNVHLRFYDILTFFLTSSSLFFSSALAIFHSNYGWVAGMNGTRKCQNAKNAYRNCIIIIVVDTVSILPVCGRRHRIYWCHCRMWRAM